jgi:hypothetical protein
MADGFGAGHASLKRLPLIFLVADVNDIWRSVRRRDDSLRLRRALALAKS